MAMTTSKTRAKMLELEVERVRDLTGVYLGVHWSLRLGLGKVSLIKYSNSREGSVTILTDAMNYRKLIAMLKGTCVILKAMRR